jgi:hypothetical protein
VQPIGEPAVHPNRDSDTGDAVLPRAAAFGAYDLEPFEFADEVTSGDGAVAAH